MKNSFAYSLAGMPKYAAGFVGTIIFRLLSPFFGLWNISPLMATELAGSKAYGPWVGALYGGFSIALVDVLMGKVGSWTLITAVTYGLVGFWGGYFFRTRDASARQFVFASIVGTLFFDLVTGVLMGPLLYGQPWGDAFFGQIPFTLRHLGGNVFFAVTLAPWFYRSIMMNPKWEAVSIIRFA